MIHQRKTLRQLCIFLVAFFVLWTLRATVFYSVDDSIVSPIARAVYSSSLKFLLWVVSAAAFASLVKRESPYRYLGLSSWPSPCVWYQCIGVTIAFLFSVVLFESAAGKKSFTLATLSSLPIVLGLLQLVLSPLFEEILFRGLVLKELITMMSKVVAIILTSLLFVGIHLPYWLTHGGATPVMLANAVGVFIFSMLAGWLYARSASVWPSALAHIANNVLSSVLVV